MNIINLLWHKLNYAGDLRLREYEVIILNEFYKQLKADEKNKLINQFYHINMVAHSDTGKLGAISTFFEINNRKRIGWSDDFRIFEKETFEVATKVFVITLEINEIKYKFRLYLSNGYLTFIESNNDFSKIPKRYLKNVCKIREFANYKIKEKIKIIHSKRIKLKVL